MPKAPSAELEGWGGKAGPVHTLDVVMPVKEALGETADPLVVVVVALAAPR